MSKKKAKRPSAPPQAQATPRPQISPSAFGPPAPIIPPPDGLTLRLGLGGESLQVELPSGRVSELTIGPDTLDLLIGVLHRMKGEAREAILEATPRHAPRWPRGLPIRFCPPHPSPWREAAFFPPGADYCSMIIDCEHRDGTIVAKAPDGKLYSINPKYVQVEGRAIVQKPRGKSPRQELALTLEDLGL